jgi:hypothetical protein
VARGDEDQWQQGAQVHKQPGNMLSFRPQRVDGAIFGALLPSLGRRIVHFKLMSRPGFCGGGRAQGGEGVAADTGLRALTFFFEGEGRPLARSRADELAWGMAEAKQHNH